MSAPQFLLDENLPPTLAGQLRRHEPRITVMAIDQWGAPPGGTGDPEILRWIEEHDFLLTTNNRHSMPGHLRNHLAGGGHIPGILIMPTTRDIGMLIEVLHLVWGASLADEYRDKITYLPFI